LVHVPGGPVYQNALVFVGHSWSPSDQESDYLGSFIVEPKRHIKTWADLTDSEAEQIGKTIRDVSRALIRSEHAEHIYVFVLGHHVPHLHIWIVPRYRETTREYWGMRLFEWPYRPRGGDTELEDICERIRSVF
jgi:histidine triad (HIT) family protein